MMCLLNGCRWSSLGWNGKGSRHSGMTSKWEGPSPLCVFGAFHSFFEGPISQPLLVH
ncbi:hypothetical protein Fmac_010848 [Flemingia macrophylla]|uniref:Ycf15 n=1 Tax=Flemingia macrophylla TaxID=520843 RepID=A0ABD1MKR1_9FABA